MFGRAGLAPQPQPRVDPFLGLLAAVFRYPSGHAATSYSRLHVGGANVSILAYTDGATMVEEQIAKFWESHPCGENVLGSKFKGDYEAFFKNYDTFRYTKEAHILECLDEIDFRGKRVLEIGLGQGADSEQIIRRGGLWSGLDLTQESVDRVRARVEIHRLPHDKIEVGSALDIPFPANSFDIVFSHGVLHHIPEIEKAQEEIRRVLKPDGELIVMLYARWSLNYILAIGVVRRLALIPLYILNFAPNAMIADHIKNAKEVGLLNYLRMKNFLHANTDGPKNPFSRVYDLARVKNHFSAFEVEQSYKCFMYAPPLPVRRLPFSKWLGWHLWVRMRPTQAVR